MAAAPTELEVIRELAHCHRLIREGRVPTLWTRRPSLCWLDSFG